MDHKAKKTKQLESEKTLYQTLLNPIEISCSSSPQSSEALSPSEKNSPDTNLNDEIAKMQRRRDKNRESAAKSRKKFNKIIEEGQIEHRKLVNFAISIETISKLFMHVHPECFIPSIKIENDGENSNLVQQIKQVLEKLLTNIKMVNAQIDNKEKALLEENKQLIKENCELIQILENRLNQS